MEEVIETVEKQNYYDILGVEQDATSEQIKQAWKALKKKYYPDNQEIGDAGLFNQTQTAYQVLIDDQQLIKS